MSLEKVTNCTRKGLGLFQSEAERNETLRDIEMSYTNYSMVIARVVPGVLIANGSKETCLVSVNDLVTRAVCQHEPGWM